MPKLPVVSGEQVIKLLKKLGYEVMRQKGSRVRLRKITEAGEQSITVLKHAEMAKGILNDILSKVSIWNNVSEEKLIEMLGKM